MADPATRLDKHLHAPVYIQDTARATSLLEAFQGRSRMRFAMVVDEYGDIMGIATLNDILEALVGDLPDHLAGEEPEAVKRADGSWLLDGLMLMEDACHVAGICMGQDALEVHKTLAGIIQQRLPEMPEIGDVVEGRVPSRERGHGRSAHRPRAGDKNGRNAERRLNSPKTG